MIVIYVAVLMVILCTTNNPITAELSLTLVVSLSVGSMIFAIQSLAVLDKIEVKWPSGLDRVLSLAQLLIFDLSSLNAVCSLFLSPTRDYILRSLLPLTIPGIYIIVYALLRVCKNTKWGKAVTVNK